MQGLSKHACPCFADRMLATLHLRQVTLGDTGPDRQLALGQALFAAGTDKPLPWSPGRQDGPCLHKRVIGQHLKCHGHGIGRRGGYQDKLKRFERSMGFSYQKARFVSAHLNEAKRLEWRQTRWPKILRQAKQRKALLLFGDEASFAQWGSLSYTWALKGQQPEVPTSGKRKAYKVFGLLDYFSGQFFHKAQAGRFNSESYATFLLDVLSQTHQHVVVIQDGAHYHTSKAMQQFFAAHAERLPIEQLPAYSPDFNPIEQLWKQVKKEATHLTYFPEFTALQDEVDRALLHFAQTPHEITVLMARYCEKLGKVEKAA